jgi:hypothetical protein
MGLYFIPQGFALSPSSAAAHCKNARKFSGIADKNGCKKTRTAKAAG